MSSELIRKSDVLDLLNEYIYDFGDNYALYSTLFDSVDGMLPADTDTEWIPFTRRPPTEEEKEENPEFCYYLDGRSPDDGEEVLVSNGRSVWVDTFSYDGDGVGFECCGAIEEDMAWMPMPKPHKGEQEGE